MVTGRNTSIAKSRLGEVRFPPRPPEPPGEMKVYHMPLEEVIKKYGPLKRPLRRNYNGAIDYQSIAAAIRTSAGQVEAADLLGIKLEDLQRYIRYYKIQPQYGLALKEKEAKEEMKTDSELAGNSNNNGPLVSKNGLPGNESGDLRNDAGHARTERKIPDKITRAWLAEELKTRSIEDIQKDFSSNIKLKFFAKKWGLIKSVNPEELLPHEKLVEYKKQRLTDSQIMKMTGLSNVDFYRLKKKYGLKEFKEDTAPLKNDAPAQDRVPVENKPGASPVGTRLSVAQVVIMREEVSEDLATINSLILSTRNYAISDNRLKDMPTGNWAVSERVLNLLTWYRDQYEEAISRIDQAFSNTEVYLSIKGGLCRPWL